jgi:hypothetical protein
MSFVFALRRMYECGEPVGAAKAHLSVRGRLTIKEQRDSYFHRVVKTATFDLVDEGEPVPRMRNVDLLLWTGNLFIITGVEDVADDKLNRPKLYCQTWQMVPEPLEELMRADRKIARLVFRLHCAGIGVQMLPNGEMVIDGERREDGEPVSVAHLVDRCSARG